MHTGAHSPPPNKKRLPKFCVAVAALIVEHETAISRSRGPTRRSLPASSAIPYVSTGRQVFLRRGDHMTVTTHKLRTDSPPLVREQIIAAALTAIEEYGPEALTGQIAKRAGLARPNVYRHFSSKEDLNRAVARSAYQELRAEILSRLDRCGTPLDVIRTPIEAQVIWADCHQNLYRFLVSRGYQRKLQQYVVERSRFANELAAAGARYFPRLAEDPDTAEATLVGLIGLFDASVLRWLSRPVGTREQLIDRLTAQAWLIIDHHFRELGSHIDPRAALPIASPDR
jgi:AcrR family transcriptional regulator